VLHHVGEKLVLLNHHCSKLDVRDLPGDALLRGVGGYFKNAAIQAALEKIVQATAIVAATPVYKAAYSRPYKAFLDLLPQFDLTDKVLLTLKIGDSQSHMLALDYALRSMLSSLAATHVLQCSV